MPISTGRYIPRNPKKYRGDLDNIVYRSSWENRFMKWADLRSDVLEWSSEELVIPYRHPIDGRIARYFPDFKIKIRNRHGVIEEWVIEIKPEKQTKEPKVRKRITKQYLHEVQTYAINHYKWEAAREFCKRKGYKFVIFTEKELGI